MAGGTLKSPWLDDSGHGPAVPTPDLGGDLAVTRGTDPLTDTSGSSGLTAVPWQGAGKQTPATSGNGVEESGNSVSGLPSMPNRFAPSPAEPPAPPTLSNRNPGTIDQK